MPLVEAFEGDDSTEPAFVADFAFLPRVGEYLAHEAGGYFRHYEVMEVWHRQEGEGGAFRACIRVVLND